MPPGGRSQSEARPAAGWAQITAAEYHTCALTAGGGVQCWGGNDFGQLGDGSTRPRNVPTTVTGLEQDIVMVSAGEAYTCAVTANGGVQCWGRNDSGQLGDGSTTNRSVPTTVTGLGSGVLMVEAGDYHTCAISEANGLQCWGDNGSGQLGDGTQINRGQPAAVAGLTAGIRSVSAGGSHTCALAGDDVACWGENGYGQLGDGTTTWRLTPVRVVALPEAIAALDSGRAHTCALTEAGAVTCWGANTYSQLGDGTSEWRLTPVQTSGLTSGTVAIAAGEIHSCAVLADQTAWC